MLELFREIDRSWDVALDARATLHLIGAGALLLQEPRHRRATKDGDIYQALPLEATVRERLLELAGRDSDLHARHRLFLEIIPNGLPFLPQAPLWHPIESFTTFDLVALDIVDVCVSKLIRFSADDVADIDAMIRLGRVAHARFVERFKSAFDVETREDKLQMLVDNFHQVETDMISAEPTPIDLPSWI